MLNSFGIKLVNGFRGSLKYGIKSLFINLFEEFKKLVSLKNYTTNPKYIIIISALYALLKYCSLFFFNFVIFLIILIDFMGRSTIYFNVKILFKFKSFKETIINHMDSAITNVVMFSFLFILFFSILISAILLTFDVISI